MAAPKIAGAANPPHICKSLPLDFCKSPLVAVHGCCGAAAQGYDAEHSGLQELHSAQKHGDRGVRRDGALQGDAPKGEATGTTQMATLTKDKTWVGEPEMKMTSEVKGIHNDALKEGNDV
ncbi:hypothetical protein TRIUR3_15138 [Triticum urartu]|uniref:Uncharacterized protein n=1 Tax=Triticum urartu TaxID=4572 RepID=M7YLH0_TRIUA|nr:hypothetical protein TRIUR3_15138 [Triticum urartu]